MSRKSQETIGPNVDIPVTTESNASQNERLPESFAASEQGVAYETTTLELQLFPSSLLMRLMRQFDDSEHKSSRRLRSLAGHCAVKFK